MSRNVNMKLLRLSYCYGITLFWPLLYTACTMEC